MVENGKNRAEKASKKAVFAWTVIKENVANAIAKGDRSIKQILAEFKVTDKVYYTWKKHPEFQRKIDEILQDIDIAQKSERIKIAKKEIKRVLARLELNEDRPTSKDLVALLRFIGDEVGDLQEHKTIKIIWDEEREENGTANN